MISQTHHRLSARRRRGGFSFTEILFAVMILGIGFIMVAAMFPVAIHQTEATTQETITASVGRQATDYMETIAGMQMPVASVQGLTPTGTTPNAPYNVLLPTFLSTTVPAASSFTLSPGQSSVIVPGQVWSMYDPNRDTWTYQYANQNPNLVYPPTSHTAAIWQAMAFNLIQASDPRFGWVAMYRRDMIAQGIPGSPASSITPAPYALLIVIGIQCRNAQTFIPAIDIQNPPTTNTPFLPQLIKGVTFNSSASGQSYVTFPSGGGGGNVAAMGDNAYVVISDDHLNPLTNPYHGMLNGRIFRAGYSSATGVWQLLPGSDLTSTDITTMGSSEMNVLGQPSFDVFVVGHRLSAGNPPTPIGAVQDVWAYSTYISTPN